MAPRLRQVKPPADAAAANSGDSRKDRLGLLHVALKDLAAEIDDETNVPDRWKTTGNGELADLDSQVLGLAATVVHRLLLWEMFPLVSPESYFKADGS